MPMTRSGTDNGGAPDAVDPGSVFYFDLEPVLARAGPTMLRNPNRLQIVCEHCVRAVTDSDEMVFAKSGFFLIVTSCEAARATQLAWQISASLLKCFYGTQGPPSDSLKMLFRRPAESEFATLATRRAASEHRAAAPAPPVVAEAPPAHEALTPPTDDPLAELAISGIHRNEGFRFGFAPVHDLRRGALSTFLCEAVRLHDAHTIIPRDSFASIGPRELPRVDQAMLLHALTFSRRLYRAGIVAAVGTSVSFETLSWPKGRQLYLNALKVAKCAANPFLIVTLDMIPPGTPQTRLAELVTAIRTDTKRIFVHLPDDGLALLQDASLGAAGYVMSARPGMTNEEVTARAMRLAKLCKQHEALSCVYRIPDLVTARRIQAAGVRFGEGNFFNSRFFFDDTPMDAIEAYQNGTRLRQAGAALEAAP